jgi:Protein of unknown function (DUF4232)
MKSRTLPAVFTMTIASALIAGCGASTPAQTLSSTSKASPSVAGQGGPACRPTQLQITAGPPVSEATQQNTLLLVFRNISPTSCVMRGYPAITLVDSAGRRLAFSYRQGGDQMLTSAPPRPVILPPGKFAYSALNKNSCVGFASRTAATAGVAPPGQHEPLLLRLRHYPMLGYCGAGDPGHTIDIAPVEPTSADALAHR